MLALLLSASLPVDELLPVESAPLAQGAQIEAVSPEEPLLVNQALEYYARSFSFIHRQVIIPQHPVLGVLLRPSQLAPTERAIYQEIAETRFWNDLDFDDYRIDPPPSPPFRSVTIGKLSALGSQRYEVLLQLESFDTIYSLHLVLLYSEENLRVLLMRHL